VLSPLKTKLACCPAELVALEEPRPAIKEGRSNIQGTATCLPLPAVAVPVAPTALVPEVSVVEAALPDVPEVPAPLREITAKSILPEAGLIIVSLMVPIWLPEEPVTCAPVNWLALNS